MALVTTPFVFVGASVVGVGLHLRQISGLVRSEMSLAQYESVEAAAEGPSADSVPVAERRVEHIDYR